MSYKSNHLLFRDLTTKEVQEFKNYVRKFCKDGFELSTLEVIHPVIRIIKKSLEEQNIKV